MSTIEQAARPAVKLQAYDSGAGQDAQMLARIVRTAMIFVPSIGGISHNPEGIYRDERLPGQNVLLDVVKELPGIRMSCLIVPGRRCRRL